MLHLEVLEVGTEGGLVLVHIVCTLIPVFV